MEALARNFVENIIDAHEDIGLHQLVTTEPILLVPIAGLAGSFIGGLCALVHLIHATATKSFLAFQTENTTEHRRAIRKTERKLVSSGVVVGFHAVNIFTVGTLGWGYFGLQALTFSAEERDRDQRFRPLILDE